MYTIGVRDRSLNWLKRNFQRLPTAGCLQSGHIKRPSSQRQPLHSSADVRAQPYTHDQTGRKVCVDRGYTMSLGVGQWKFPLCPLGRSILSLRSTVTRTARRLSGLQGVSATTDNAHHYGFLLPENPRKGDLNLRLSPIKTRFRSRWIRDSKEEGQRLIYLITMRL